jgi:hypothetical protein
MSGGWANYVTSDDHTDANLSAKQHLVDNLENRLMQAVYKQAFCAIQIKQVDPEVLMEERRGEKEASASCK